MAEARTSQRARSAALLAAAVSSVLTALGLAGVAVGHVALARAGRDDLSLLSGGGAAFGLAAVSATAVGVVLLRTSAAHPVGWCFAALGSGIAVTGAAQAYASWGLLARDGAPLAGSAAAVSSTGYISWMTLVGLVCALTPDGRPLSRPWGWAAWGLLGAGGLWLLTAAVTPGPLEEAPFVGVPNPWGLDLPGVRTVRGIAANASLVLLVLCAASLVVRFRRTRGDERSRLLWMAVAAVPVPAVVALMVVAASTGADRLLDVTAGVFAALLPVSAALAITRYHLYEVERILSRAVVYLLLSAVLAATYATAVVLVGNGVGGLAGSSAVAVASATLLVAVAARPLHRTMQDAVDRRFTRRRYDALRRVRAYVAAPEPGVPVEQVLRDVLAEPGLEVAYWIPERGRWATGEGEDARPCDDDLPVIRAGRTVASVSAVGPPDLVAEVLHAAGPALESAGLRAAVALQLQEVRASRARIASAQVRERRRIERDLHDGAQQRLLALAAQLQAALMNGGPDRQREALRTGVEQSQAAVRELRALANGLHPAALTDGGLGAALDELATRLPVRISVDPQDERWPVEVEATAWFVACEAVSNAVKHAGAQGISLDLHQEGAVLVLRVEDGGPGGADRTGPGLRGLADRVEAVGGRLTVSDRPAGGTCLEAVLPCGS